MTEPASIYRFLDSHAALKTLEAGKFRVGLLSKFNDPFEWRLGFTGITTPEEQKTADKLKSEHQPWLESWMGAIWTAPMMNARDSLPCLKSRQWYQQKLLCGFKS
jgi:hypothetical protein